MTYEKKVSHVRSLDTWSVRLTAGYIPPFFGSDRADTFGLVQLTHNLGGAWRSAAEGRHLAAREDELKSSRYELTSRIGAFRASIGTPPRRRGVSCRSSTPACPRSVPVERPSRPPTP